ncbi:MAG: succinate dehydrogenase, hydrophobic membrane anchor protein [Rhodobacterales bacterium]|nr:MAG: succinate dehydrogenase, hydrophobic membrane anchor protein [Rhodobacterales bacterium]
MSDKMSKRRFLGIGDHKGGLGHWSLQRLTSLIIMPLSVFFIYTIMTTFGKGYGVMIETYQSTFNAGVAVLFFATVFYHISLGVEVVIDDYIPNPTQHKLFMLLNKLFFRALSAISVLSVLVIYFSA